MEFLEDKFQFPQPGDYGENLIGKRLNIFWSGDNVFYQGLVIKYDAAKDRHVILYENDPTAKQYNENLRKQLWKIWAGTEEEYVENYSKVTGSFLH
jgi:hypothetical protein